MPHPSDDTIISGVYDTVGQCLQKSLEQICVVHLLNFLHRVFVPQAGVRIDIYAGIGKKIGKNSSKRGKGKIHLKRKEVQQTDCMPSVIYTIYLVVVIGCYM